VFSGIVDLFSMAGHARLVGLVLRLELVPTARSVAMEAIEFSRLGTGAHKPRGVGIVFSQIATIRVIVRIFESHQTIMIEEPVPRLEGICEHDGLGMTRGACRIVLLLGKVTTAAFYFHVFRNGSLWGFLTDANVFIRGTVAGLAVDAGLNPFGLVRIGLQIVVGGNLADVAPVTGGVEGVLPVLPVYRFIRLTRKVPHPARSHVEPLLLVHVVRYGQSLEPTAIHGGEKVIDILSAQCMIDPIFLLAFGPPFNDPPFLAGDVSTVPVVPNNDFFLLGGELGVSQFSGIGLHGQPVVGRGPQLVELLVAFSATGRTGKRAGLGRDLGSFGSVSSRLQSTEP